MPELTADVSAGVFSRGVEAFDAIDLVSSSSSSPNDSLPLAAILRFFLNAGLGVDALCLANKHAQYRLYGRNYTLQVVC